MPSLFENHELIVTGFCTEQVPKPNNFAVGVVCVILLLFTLAMVLYRRKMNYLVRSLFSQRYYSLLMRESKVLEERIFLILLPMSLSVFALTASVLTQRYASAIIEKLTFIGTFAMFLGIFIVLYFFKFICNVFYTYLFDHQKERYSLNLYKFVFVSDAAMFLMPFLLVGLFVGLNVWIYAYIPMAVCLFGLLLYKLMKINPKKINLFHFFLYFCTLEILPYLVLLKAIAMMC